MKQAIALQSFSGRCFINKQYKIRIFKVKIYSFVKFIVLITIKYDNRHCQLKKDYPSIRHCYL